MKNLFLLLSFFISINIFGQKTTDLQEETTTSTDSWVEIVSMPTQKNKKIKVKNLITSGNNNSAWTTSGNTGLTGASFIGTTDSVPVKIRSNNIEAVRIFPSHQTIGIGYTSEPTNANNGLVVSGNVGIGTNSPTEKLSIDGNIAFSSSTKYLKYTRSANDSSFVGFFNSSTHTSVQMNSNSILGSASISSGQGKQNVLQVTTNTNNTTIQEDSTDIIISSSYPTFAGAQYDQDYSANYTARSLADKGYVDSYLPIIITGTVIPTALTPSTTITASGYQISAASRHGLGTSGDTIVCNMSGFFTSSGTTFAAPIIQLDMTSVSSQFTGYSFIANPTNEMIGIASGTNNKVWQCLGSATHSYWQMSAVSPGDGGYYYNLFFLMVK